jgi:hypothetical protein
MRFLAVRMSRTWHKCGLLQVAAQVRQSFNAREAFTTLRTADRASHIGCGGSDIFTPRALNIHGIQRPVAAG